MKIIKINVIFAKFCLINRQIIVLNKIITIFFYIFSYNVVIKLFFYEHIHFKFKF